ncbi:hypothetical protein [Vulcaniibacterium gelatinicum]|uniref:hypothetical protein n=1 Tax=Vulcaniibacterium gelatinicum TaxID=2598725 RepID=UPI0011CB6E3E|nr:hypothetical protein [Vulcaniibacterium gelatinicum]
MEILRIGFRHGGGLLALALLAIVLGLGAFPTTGRAGAMAVVEIGPNFLQSLLNQINTYTQRYQDAAEYALQAQRWYQTYQHMRQQLIRLQGIVTSLQSKELVLEERDESHGVEACGGAGSPFGAILGWLQIDLDGEVVSQQKEVCRLIVVARNRQYNMTIKTLRKLQDLQSQWQQIEQRRQASNEQGNVAANDNDALRFMSGMQQELHYWEATMNAYDSYIRLLNAEQARLAESAMRGKRAVFGAVVQGAALRTALKAARRRER